MRSLPDPAGGLTAPPRPPAVLHAASGGVGLGHRGSHSPREKPPTKVFRTTTHQQSGRRVTRGGRRNAAREWGRGRGALPATPAPGSRSMPHSPPQGALAPLATSLLHRQILSIIKYKASSQSLQAANHTITPSTPSRWKKVKAAVQVHSHFTYNVLLYATVWQVLSKHDSSSESGNTLCVCTIISEIH